MTRLDKSVIKIYLQSRELFKIARISDSQFELIKSIRDSVFHGVTARMVADMKDCSIQNASTTLNSLWKKGFLEREEEYAESGGIEYRYFVSVKFK